MNRALTFIGFAYSCYNFCKNSQFYSLNPTDRKMKNNYITAAFSRWVTFSHVSLVLSSLSAAVYSRLEWEFGLKAKSATRDSDLSGGWSKGSFWKQLKTCQQLQGRGMHIYFAFLPQQVQSHQPFFAAPFFIHLSTIFLLFIFFPLFPLSSASFHVSDRGSTPHFFSPPAFLLLLTLKSALITKTTALRAEAYGHT